MLGDEVAQAVNINEATSLGEVFAETGNRSIINNLRQEALGKRPAWGPVIFRVLIALRAGILHKDQRDAADLTHMHMLHSSVVRGLTRRGCRARRQEGPSPTRSFT